MNNDYNFWNNYLIDTYDKLKKLVGEKDIIRADFHVHSNYSADSDVSLEQIISRAINLKFDIISVTDHDSVDVYDELYEILLKQEIDNLIIIPGVEFTIDNKEYGSQFHMLQLMINPKSESIIKDTKYQKEACWYRASRQFERLSYNKAMQYFIDQYNIECSMDRYKQYLSKCFRPIPEYKTLMEYIMSEFIPHGITNWNIFEMMEKCNDNDPCYDRKQIKINNFIKLKTRFINQEDSNYNKRFFHCLLAVKGADDDYFPDYECEGDLSVNHFNELKLFELNRDNLTFFAHPSQDKLDLLNNLLKLNPNICGMEFNKRCKYNDPKLFFKKQKELNLIKIIGSDIHDIDSDLYQNLDFYNHSKDEINSLINMASKFIDK